MIDTLKVARRLREAGFSEPQADAVIATVQEACVGAGDATKHDLEEHRAATKREFDDVRAAIERLRAEIKAEIAAVRAEIKAEIAAVRAEIKAEIAAVRAEVKAAIATVFTEMKAETAAIRSEMRESELRLEAKIEALKSDILTRVFAFILGAVVVNAITVVGGVFAIAKLLGH